MENIMDFLTFRHSFNSGDLITVLPGVKKLCEERGKKAIIYQRLDLLADYSHNDNHPIKSEDGRQVCMNLAMFNLMKPLLDAQDYIHSFEVWKGEKTDFDYDMTRQNAQMPLPNGSIHHWVFLIYPQMECDLSVPWISVKPDAVIADGMISINFTERYRNPYIDYFFLKPHENRLIFLGTELEHTIFCEKWGLNVLHYKVKDFLRAAYVLSATKFFMGNQSFLFHLCDSMKVPRILEVCAQYPNSFPTGANGHSFITQGALEWQFNQLIQ